MGGREAAKDNVEGLSAVDGAKAYRQGLSLCGEGLYEKALLVRQKRSPILSRQIAASKYDGCAMHIKTCKR